MVSPLPLALDGRVDFSGLPDQNSGSSNDMAHSDRNGLQLPRRSYPARYRG